jgi:hypothetical protein
LILDLKPLELWKISLCCLSHQSTVLGYSSSSQLTESFSKIALTDPPLNTSQCLLSTHERHGSLLHDYHMPRMGRLRYRLVKELPQSQSQ